MCISAGDAYPLWGKARWKMLHDAIVPPTVPTIQNLGNLERVGLTFRYFRRSWLELCRLEKLPNQSHAFHSSSTLTLFTHASMTVEACTAQGTYTHTSRSSSRCTPRHARSPCSTCPMDWAPTQIGRPLPKKAGKKGGKSKGIHGGKQSLLYNKPLILLSLQCSTYLSLPSWAGRACSSVKSATQP